MIETAIYTAAIGAGATLVMDLWGLILRYVYGVSGLDYRFVGRWLGYLPRKYVHDDIKRADPVPGELLFGWLAHYAIGVLFAAGLVAVVGTGWLQNPTILPALMTGIVTVAAPFFILQPALGFGMAASRSPKPNAARLRSLITHIVFGAGLFLASSLLASLQTTLKI